MTSLEVQKLPEFLLRQRWFAGKAWPIKSVTLIDQAQLSGNTQAQLSIIQVHYGLGADERYLLALTPNSNGDIAEALHDDAFANALFNVLRSGGTVPAGSGHLRGEPIDEARLLELPSTMRPRPLGVDQTNTSLVFDERVILKVIRKLEPGLNPEYEVGRFLARVGFTGTPPLIGAIHLEGAASTTVALAHGFIPGGYDGWRWLLEALDTQPFAFVLGELRGLGRVIGELHSALASDRDDREFAPEPVQLEDLQRWGSSLIGELGVTLNEASKAFPKIADRREASIARAHSLARLRPSGQKIRVHGDLHLRQLLRSETGWLVIDFEGEPRRKLAQRREKQSPLKDIAGMLRSFAYADAVRTAKADPDPTRAPAMRAAFLEGYRQAVAAQELLPTEGFEEALDAFELEKLLYEIRYELANRPDWARIPVGALMGDAAR